MNHELEGKVALVTGAASKRGLGHGIALRLAAAGAKLVLLDKYEAPPSYYAGDEAWRGLQEVVEEITALGQMAISVKADVSDGRQVSEAVDLGLSTFGRVDILVNCAGTVQNNDMPVAEMNEEEWNRVLGVNLTGAFLVSKAAARDMIRRKAQGKIVHISSITGKKGAPGHAAYAASKFGLIGLVQSLALELAPYKVNVNAVCPGAIPTNVADSRDHAESGKTGASVEEIRRKRYERLTFPLARFGTVEDVAELVLFLVSSRADYITGHDVNITGGLWMS